MRATRPAPGKASRLNYPKADVQGGRLKNIPQPKTEKSGEDAKKKGK